MAQRQQIARPKKRTIPPKLGLQNFDIEVSYGGYWVSLNDQINYRVSAESLANTAQTHRKIEVNNPVVEGSYLVHLTPENMQETLKIYCYGDYMQDTMQRANTLVMLFTQFDYQIRVTLDNSQEYWRCLPADWTMERQHTHVHQGMVIMGFTVPRLPTVEYKVLV